MREPDMPSGHPPERHPRRGLLARLPKRRLAVAAAAAVVAGLLLTVAIVRLTGTDAPAAGDGGPATSGPGTASPAPPGEREESAPGPGADPPATPGPRAGPGVCPPFPEFPDETCTGHRHTGVELRPCPNVIDQNGAELDGCRFGRDLVIQASDVTITRSFVDGTVYGTHLTDWSLGNLTLVDVEIDGGGQVVDDHADAIDGDDYTCIRCHIHGTERGANFGSNIHIEESYIHGLIHRADSHQSAASTHGGSNLTFIHNNIECESTGDSCSTALALYPDFGPVDNVLVQNNLLNTNGGYCTYGGFDQGTNIRYIDNVFGTKYYPQCGIWGPVVFFDAQAEGNVWRGNRYPDGTEVRPKYE